MPNYSSKEDTQGKGLIIDVVACGDTYMKVIADTPYIRPQFPVCVHSKLFATGWADEKLVKMKNGVTDIPNKPQKP